MRPVAKMGHPVVVVRLDVVDPGRVAHFPDSESVNNALEGKAVVN